MIYVVPNNRAVVFDPDESDYIPESGRYVSKDTYWTRRIQSGEVVVVNKKKKSMKEKKKKEVRSDTV